jgi:peptidyl-dipeptidase Dcp
MPRSRKSSARWSPEARRVPRPHHPEREALQADRRRLRAREKSGLEAEQKRLAWLKYQDFARSGAKLDATAKAKLSEINQRLATLYTEFSQNVLADEGSALILEREADLAACRSRCARPRPRRRSERGEPGKWAILNTRSSVEPFLTYSERRDLRREGVGRS